MAGFTLAQYQAAFIHEARESLSDRYLVMVSDGDLKVFDKDIGAEYIVTFPSGKDYLTSDTGFKAITVGGTTYLLNLDTYVRRGTTKATAQKHQALVVVQSAEFSVTYTVTVDGAACSITTPGASSGATISSDYVAQRLMAQMDSQLGSDYTLVQSGPTIQVERADAGDFSITSSDGLSDKGLKIIKETVQSFADLPERAVNGMILRIAGDPTTHKDDMWVRYTADAPTLAQLLNGAAPIGVWRECAAPGTPVDLNAQTMPWTLSRNSLAGTSLMASRDIPLPVLTTSSQTVFSTGYTLDPDTSTSYLATQDVELTNHNQRIQGTIPTVTAGANPTVFVSFDVDTTLLSTSQSVTVEFRYNGTLVRSLGFLGGDYILGFTTDYIGTVTTGDTIELKLVYGSGVTPTTNKAKITVHGSGSNPPGIQGTFLSAKRVAFVPSQVYPMGAVVSLVANSFTYTHTISSADETGTTVANYFKSVMTDHFTVTASGDGAFVLTNTDGSAITWSVSATVTYDNGYAFVPDITLSAGSLVGLILTNTTDGSTGTITANSVNSIQTSGMSGGINNQIHTGDVLSVQGVSNTFVFAPGVWDLRKAGDLDTCPLPSFVDHTIEDLFFYRNRLGFTAADHVVLSQSGRMSNFMRQTAAELLADDVIDIHSAHPNTGSLEHAAAWNESLYLFSTAGHQFRLGGDPLTPQTIALEKVSNFPVTEHIRPVPVGKFMYFLRAKSSFTQVMEMFLDVNGKVDARDATEDIPKYISGAPLKFTGDSNLEMLFVLTDAAPDTLWVHSYHFDRDTTGYGEQRKVQSSWSKWTFPGVTNILHASTNENGLLELYVLRADGAYLETIDLGVIADGTADYRDRQGSIGNETSYTSRYRLSRVYMRDKDGVAETRGRLQLRYGTFNFHDSKAFDVTVTPDGRSANTQSYSSGTPAEGNFEFPILTRNTYATIEVTSNGASGFALNGFDWEGDYTTRDRRI